MEQKEEVRSPRYWYENFVFCVCFGYEIRDMDWINTEIMWKIYIREVI